MVGRQLSSCFLDIDMHFIFYLFFNFSPSFYFFFFIFPSAYFPANLVIFQHEINYVF